MRVNEAFGLFFYEKSANVFCDYEDVSENETKMRQKRGYEWNAQEEDSSLLLVSFFFIYINILFNIFNTDLIKWVVCEYLMILNV